MKRCIAAFAACLFMLVGCGESSEKAEMEQTSQKKNRTIITSGVEIPKSAVYSCDIYMVFKNGTKYSVRRNYFNKRDNVVMEVSFQDDYSAITNLNIYDNIYDRSGRLVKYILHREAEGADVSDTECNMDYYDNGLLLRYKDHFSGYEYEYGLDENGRPASVYKYDIDSGNLISVTNNEYDDNGDVVRCFVEYDAFFGGSQEIIEYKYDDRHRVVWDKTSKIPDDNVCRENIYVYEDVS